MRALVTMVAIGTVVFVLSLLVVRGYQLNRDVDSVLYRAQVAADRDDMLEYVREAKKNMEDYGMTRGHTALLFKTPQNDMALNYKAVSRLAERLESLSAISRTGTAYQVALDDMRGTIRELYRPAMGYLWVAYGWWVGLLIMALAVIIICLWHDELV